MLFGITGVPQPSTAFEVICSSKNSINCCRLGFDIDKQKE